MVEKILFTLLRFYFLNSVGYSLRKGGEKYGTVLYIAGSLR